MGDIQQPPLVGNTGIPGYGEIPHPFGDIEHPPLRSFGVMDIPALGEMGGGPVIGEIPQPAKFGVIHSGGIVGDMSSGGIMDSPPFVGWIDQT